MGAIATYRTAGRREQEPPKFMTIYEAAAYCRTSYRTIKRAIDEGRIPCAKLGDQTYRILRDNLDRFIGSGGAVETVDGEEV